MKAIQPQAKPCEFDFEMELCDFAHTLEFKSQDTEEENHLMLEAINLSKVPKPNIEHFKIFLKEKLHGETASSVDEVSSGGGVKPLVISRAEFKRRLREPKKTGGNPCFSGIELRTLLSGVLVKGQKVEPTFIDGGWRFGSPTRKEKDPSGGIWIAAEDVYKECVENGNITPTPMTVAAPQKNKK